MSSGFVFHGQHCTMIRDPYKALVKYPFVHDRRYLAEGPQRTGMQYARTLSLLWEFNGFGPIVEMC